ncbi:hypothetical protein NWP17_16285 [Chrysosporum bergii ANA360D]|uniref:Uncharacterized protein n=1 Tax=Chrysosporum bergii ANA360D TaxID=617107 RepID=A0AA43GUK5_9CYAN|nr:hypothetical protein [Chrysosporum bergii]MDH6061973.1 hypothetical protein [Chrysosporum bergii ANA360D]
MQIGNRASERSKAKIYPEEYHLQEMEERLLYEEAAFSARLRGKQIPLDQKLNGNGKNISPQNTTAQPIEKSEQIELQLWN